MERERGSAVASSQVVGGPMALVASVQHLAPLLNSMLTSERPQMHLQYHHAGEPAPTCPTQLGCGWDLGSDILLSTDHWEFSDSHQFSFLFLPWSMLCPPSRILFLDLLANSYTSFRTLLEHQLC